MREKGRILGGEKRKWDWEEEEYAALIIEELDPDNLGYIEVYILSNYFLNFIFTPIFVKNKRGSNVNIILLKLDTKKNELKCQIWKLRIYSFCCSTIVNEPKASFKNFQLS